MTLLEAPPMRLNRERTAELLDVHTVGGFSPMLDTDRLERAWAVFTELLVHTKGRFARQPFVPADWQWDEILVPLLGFVVWDAELEDHVRLFKLLWLEIARKNGKSELLAALALILLAADDEEGAEVYGAALDRDQAAKVFDVAKRMVELAGLEAPRGPFKIAAINKRIVYLPTASVYQVVAGDAKGNLGHNPHGIIFDEIVAQPDRELWDSMRTGEGVRSQPLMAAATTAGDDPTGFAKSEHDFSVKVAAKPELDPRRLAVIRNVPSVIDGKVVDPFDESLWPLGNPALGTFLRRQTLRDEATVARNDPSALRSFRMYRLNQWLDEKASAWLSLDVWDQAAPTMLAWEEFKGRDTIIGLDLSSTTDLTSAAYVMREPELPEGFAVKWRFWVPEDRVADLDRRTAGAASVWVSEGRLIPTEGDSIDYDAVFDRFTRDISESGMSVVEVAFDRWGAADVVQRIAKVVGEDRVVQIGQGYQSMTAPMRELERLLRRSLLRHGGDPVARWQFGNIMVRTDESDNIRPDRKSSRDKIDGIVAEVMALGRWLAQTPRKSRKVVAF